MRQSSCVYCPVLCVLIVDSQTLAESLADVLVAVSC